MKILYVSNTANFSKFNKPFMKWCTEQGWQVDYCAPSDESVTDCNKHIVLAIPRSPFSKGVFKCIHELRKILEQEHYDIIHCHTPMGSVIARLAAKKLYKKHQVKIIYTAHGFHFYKGAPLLNWLLYYPVEKYLIKYTDVLITINKEDFERASKKFGKRVQVEYMNGVGVNLTRFSDTTAEQISTIRKSFNCSDEDFIITVVAELNKNKNQQFLIKEINTIRKSIPTLKVFFLGKESLPIARNLVTQNNLEDYCFFMGYRKDVDLFEKMSNICFSSSIREGLPVNVIEGFACGKICICSKNRGHNSLINHNDNGLLFDLSKPSDMVDEIISVYKDKELAKRLSENAIESAQQYKVETAVDFMSKIYKTI